MEDRIFVKVDSGRMYDVFSTVSTSCNSLRVSVS